MKTESTASRVIRALKQQGLTLATAESCTGGLVGKLLTDIPGSSAVYLGGVISYTNGVKHKLLEVSQDTLYRFTAVSEQSAEEMALGAKKAIGSDLAVSVTGLAGPDGDGTGRPIGLVYIGCASADSSRVCCLHLEGDREAIREQAAEAALQLVLSFLK